MKLGIFPQTESYRKIYAAQTNAKTKELTNNIKNIPVLRLRMINRFIFAQLDLNYSFSIIWINLIFLHCENGIPCISRIKLIICNSKIGLFPRRCAKMHRFINDKTLGLFIDLNLCFILFSLPGSSGVYSISKALARG